MREAKKDLGPMAVATPWLVLYVRLREGDRLKIRWSARPWEVRVAHQRPQVLQDKAVSAFTTGALLCAPVSRGRAGQGPGSAENCLAARGIARSLTLARTAPFPCTALHCQRRSHPPPTAKRGGSARTARATARRTPGIRGGSAPPFTSPHSRSKTTICGPRRPHRWHRWPNVYGGKVSASTGAGSTRSVYHDAGPVDAACSFAHA